MAARVALTFHLDPLTVLDATAEDMQIRAACADAADELIAQQEGM